MKKLALLASVIMLAGVGCADRDTAVEEERPATTPPPATSPAPPPAEPPASAPRSEVAPPTTEGQAAVTTDQELISRVQDALRQDPTLASAADNIQITASNGTVTLTGSVSSEQEKADIGAKARQVAGVTQVNNQLEVSSASATQ
ncbi:MAG: BON domain-containing protein [Thermodesulfobacteriota bacterium]